MKIAVTWGVGTGSTRLSSFDKALWDAGIANLNLICLSSVIPPGSIIEVKKAKLNNAGKNYGRKVYVVLASASTKILGEHAFAGIGWRMTKKDKKGLFVEHHGNSGGEVRKKINSTLTDMVRYREEKYGKVKYKITGIECKGDPVTALVCAVYKIEEW
ncbi:MAG: pyruvoyl-dependent arginine decarboxylase [Candidatus Moranbacteria bacterium]|nr:pyruvoyl-dependent arginine decarboxylase [Candidatus Moranbacteria bacterium]